MAAIDVCHGEIAAKAAPTFDALAVRLTNTHSRLVACLRLAYFLSFPRRREPKPRETRNNSNFLPYRPGLRRGDIQAGIHALSKINDLRRAWTPAFAGVAIYSAFH